MSNPFGSSNHFTGANNSSANATSYGLRQRHSSTASNVGTTRSDENANPNKSDIPTYGKWGAGAMSKVPAPPRMSLATAGKSTFPSRRSATAQQQQLPTENRSNAESSNQQAVVRINEKDEEDLTLWVVGYGYRNEAHFRSLYHRLESCGVITARRGGLSCFGEGTSQDDNGSNWVAVRYQSALCAQKALCQHGNFLSIGGSTMVIGVMPLSESDAAAKLGINVNNGSATQEIVTLSGSYSNRNQCGLRTEADVMLYEGEQGGIIDNEVKSGLDSLCGKVLAWFFMWDTQA